MKTSYDIHFRCQKRLDCFWSQKWLTHYRRQKMHSIWHFFKVIFPFSLSEFTATPCFRQSCYTSMRFVLPKEDSLEKHGSVISICMHCPWWRAFLLNFFIWVLLNINMTTAKHRYCAQSSKPVWVWTILALNLAV